MKLLNQAGCSSLLTKKLVGRIGKAGKTPKEQLIDHSFGRSIFPNMMPSGARLRAHGAVRPDGNSDGTDCEWQITKGSQGNSLLSRICTIKSVACQTIPHLFFSINKTRSIDWKSSLCFGFIWQRQVWRSVDFCCRKRKVLLKLEQGPIGFQYKQEH